MRGVTCFQAIATISAPISTRTPHAGSDSQSRVHLGEILQFQPALPMRGVTKLTRYSRAEDVFQPALPMRGVTRVFHGVLPDFVISTRTPHAGSDCTVK